MIEILEIEVLVESDGRQWQGTGHWDVPSLPPWAAAWDFAGQVVHAFQTAWVQSVASKVPGPLPDLLYIAGDIFVAIDHHEAMYKYWLERLEWIDPRRVKWVAVDSLGHVPQGEASNGQETD